MQIIKEKNLKEALKQIDSAFTKKKPVIVQGHDIEFNRKILDNKKIKALILEHKRQNETKSFWIKSYSLQNCQRQK